MSQKMVKFNVRIGRQKPIHPQALYLPHIHINFITVPIPVFFGQFVQARDHPISLFGANSQFINDLLATHFLKAIDILIRQNQI
jgi:hypothetical protein